MTIYRAPEGVSARELAGRPLLSTPQGGLVAVDGTLLSLWKLADGLDLEELVRTFRTDGANSAAIRAALACLVSAGLLVRDGEKPESQKTALATGVLISVVIVSYNSRVWLRECLCSLAQQAYSPLEVILVDNASSDNSAEWARDNCPDAKVLRLAEPHSFSYAINQGVAAASGAYFLLMNPDVKLEPDAITQMLGVASRDPVCAAVASNLRFAWAPAFLNGLGNRVGSSSWGTDNCIGHLDLGQFDAWQAVPSACFAATLISRAAWNSVGPADEGFPLYYEDTEWSYRARLLGHSIRLAPHATAYHAFGSSVPDGKEAAIAPRKLGQVAYGRLRFAAKLLGGDFLRRYLANYGHEDWAGFQRALAGRKWAVARAYLGAWRDFARDLPGLRRMHRSLQRQRVLSDEELLAPPQEFPVAFIWHGLPELTWPMILQHYLPLFRQRGTPPMPEFLPSGLRPHVLIVSNDVVDTKMAGPGMRYLEMARSLINDADVTLAVPSATELRVPGVLLVGYNEAEAGSLRVLVENSDVALISGYMVDKFPFLQSTRTRLVVDLYDPFLLENLHYHSSESPADQETLNQLAVDATNRLARVGDFFICGSERQRDLWMGVLAANGRINPRTFAQDGELRALIDVVGIGFPRRELQHHPLLRGVHPAFSKDSRIVLWGGGIWDWLDPLTLVRAWPKVLLRNPEARLVFLGTRHPNPAVPHHRMADQTVALAVEIGEKEKTIFFYEWIPYEERESLLHESDIGVALHPPHVETRYSIRTRVLDYLWARLPVLVSDGDITSDWIRLYGVGEVVPPQDSDAAAKALGRLLEKPKEWWQSQFDCLREAFYWPTVVAPLRRYCLSGSIAPDRSIRSLRAQTPAAAAQQVPSLLPRALNVWRTLGFRAALRRTWQYALGRPVH
jgi:GT2 family glycosyltransferase/glycosyltransferase involved in cell wall biosynthesis